MNTEIRDILNWTIAQTREAGKLALDLYRAGAKIEKKADNTLVTNIDRAVEAHIRNRIGDDFPSFNVYGEEEGMDEGISPDAPLWAIDPVDGTANMAHGLPIWCISVGLIVKGVPTVGVIYAPLLGVLYSAGLGLGAERNGMALPHLGIGGISDDEDLYACCSASARQMDFSGMNGRIRVPGSAALNLCWAADGTFTGAQGIGVQLYDVAAGNCIARETGCETRWWKGNTTWSASEMMVNGKRQDALMTAPPATLDYLQTVLRKNANQ